VHRRRAVHVGFYALGVFDRVRKDAVRVCPIEKVALSHRALTHDLIVDNDLDAMPPPKWVEIATSEMRQGDLVSVINVEERAIATPAHDVQLFAVVGDEPIECTQRYAAFLIHERNQSL